MKYLPFAIFLVSFSKAAFALSEFDRFTQTLTTFPNSLEELLQKGESYCEDKPPASRVTELPVVDSRSLQRDHTDLAHPRRLGSFCGTFLGSAEKANAVEIISNDADTGKPAFYVIEDFGVPNKKPKIHRQPDDLPACVSCHHHSGPMFTRGPWSEMDGSRVQNFQGLLTTDTDDLSLKINEARKKLGLTPWEQVHPSIQVQAPPAASQYDISLRFFNRGMQISEICRHGCGTDLDCKKHLLLYAMMSSFKLGSNNYDQAQQFKEDSLKHMTHLLKQRWPDHGYGQISSAIADRDPFIHADQGGQTEWLEVTDRDAFIQHFVEQRKQRGLAPLPHSITNLSAIELSQMIQYDDTNPFISFARDPAHMIVGVPGVVLRHEPGFSGKSPGNPKAERPIINRISDPSNLGHGWGALGSFCFGHYFDRDYSYLNDYSPQEIKDLILNTQYSQNAVVALLGNLGLMGKKDPKTAQAEKDLFEPWPPSRERIQNSLKTLLRSSTSAAQVTAPGCVPDSNLAHSIVPASVPQIVTTLPHNSNLQQKLEFYCARCHREGHAQKLPLSDLSALRKYKNGLVMDRMEGIKDNIMPPKKPANLPRPTDEDRREMIEELRSM